MQILHLSHNAVSKRPYIYIVRIADQAQIMLNQKPASVRLMYRTCTACPGASTMAYSLVLALVFHRSEETLQSLPQLPAACGTDRQKMLMESSCAIFVRIECRTKNFKAINSEH